MLSSTLTKRVLGTALRRVGSSCHQSINTPPSRVVSSILTSRSLSSTTPGAGGTTTQAAQADRSFQTWTSSSDKNLKLGDPSKPGSAAFADTELDAVADLYHQFAIVEEEDHGNCDSYLNIDGVRALLNSIGERPNDETLRRLFDAVDSNGNGKIGLQAFLRGADQILGDSPARIVLVVGGPGSGKGMLCDRLAAKCGVVHLSSGDLLRDEVERDTPLGREVAAIMARGELVSSAVMVTLMRRRMRAHPGKRIILDGFPRSLENASDLVDLMGVPELALHLECDDTILMERIIHRGRTSSATNGGESARSDDNIDTALRRLRVYHKYHDKTMEWLREQHVPIVNLDCSGTPENVWQQLLAIGRLMRPVAQKTSTTKNSTSQQQQQQEQQQPDSEPDLFGT
jgi:adenylate kinase